MSQAMSLSEQKFNISIVSAIPPIRLPPILIRRAIIAKGEISNFEGGKPTIQNVHCDLTVLIYGCKSISALTVDMTKSKY